MNISKYLLLLTKILILLMFLVLFLKNILIGMVIFIALNLFFISRPYFSKFDMNKKIMLTFAALFFLSYLVNLRNYNYINSVGAGGSNPFLQTAFNGFSWLVLVYFGYSIGNILSNNEERINKLLKFCLFLFLLNGVINIIVWITTTGGVISRYSFVSPITGNVSAGVLFSLLGFFLVDAVQIKFNYLKMVYKLLFLINIIIVGTRQVQIMFCLYLIYYNLLSFSIFKNKRIKMILTFFIVAPLLFSVIIIVFPSLAPIYGGLFNLNSDDYYVREVTQNAAIGLFKSNPIFGVGYGMFGMYNSAILSAAGNKLDSAHNGFYSIISEMGITGFLLTLVLFINIFRITRKVLNDDKGKSKLDIVCIVFLRGIILFFFISNFDLLPPPNERSYYLYGFIMWLLYGIISGRVNKDSAGLSSSGKKRRRL